MQGMAKGQLVGMGKTQAKARTPFCLLMTGVPLSPWILLEQRSHHIKEHHKYQVSSMVSGTLFWWPYRLTPLLYWFRGLQQIKLTSSPPEKRHWCKTNFISLQTGQSFSTWLWRLWSCCASTHTITTKKVINGGSTFLEQHSVIQRHWVCYFQVSHTPRIISLFCFSSQESPWPSPQLCLAPFRARCHNKCFQQ